MQSGKTNSKTISKKLTSMRSAFLLIQDKALASMTNELMASN